MKYVGIWPVLLASVVLFAGQVDAQSYTATAIANDFNTHNISATGTILVGGAGTDDGQEVVNFPVGFTFNFYGVPYTSCVVNSNGWISLGSTLQTTDTLVMRTPPTTVPSAAAPNNYIAGNYDDLNPPSATGGKVKWELLSSPSRFVVLYDQVHHYQFGPQTTHFAIVLYQTTDIIEIHYSTGQTITTAPTAAAIENATGTDGTARPGGIGVIPVPTDAFRFTPPANFPPAIAVVRNATTTPVPVAPNGTVVVPANATVASVALRFTATDTNALQTLNLTTQVTPSANIAGFVQAQWNAGPGTASIIANPAAGTFSTLGPIQVIVSATDGVAAPTTFTFTISVEPPQIELGSTASTSGNTIPFNSTTQYRHMTVYSTTDLAALPAGSLITGLRVHTVTAVPTPAPVWSTMKVLIGPSTTVPTAMSSTFDLNYSGAPTVVLDAANFAPTPLSGTTTLARYHFPFTTPYLYTGGNITIEFQMGPRTVGTGFNIVSLTGRQRVYSAVAGLPPTGTLTTTAGNFGLALDFIQSPNGGLLAPMSVPATGIAAPMTDTVVMRFNAFAFTSARNLNSITFNQTGTISNAGVSNVKLVRDNNNNGLVDAGDTVLGSGVLSGGAITFTGAPLQAVATGTPVGLLLAASISSVQPAGTTMRFSIAAAANVTWSPSGDLGSYPMTSDLWVQRLAGNYTIAQTAAADFNDIGAAFDALELLGVSGPVTMTIIDSATYNSTPSYTLGTDNVLPVPGIVPIAGVSAANRITLRAATGQTPKIQGNATGAVLIGQTPTTALTGRGALCINHSYVTVEGLEVFGGPNFGIMVQGNVSGAYVLHVTDVIIRRCKVYDIPDGPGIANMSQNGAYATNILIEHNFVWNCFTNSGNPATSSVLLLNTGGAITLRNPASGSGIVRHNTVLHTSTFNTTGALYAYASSSTFPLHDVNNNIFISTSGTTPALQFASAAHLPTTANFNCFFATTFCNQATLNTFALWQAAGKDANGLNTDPLLVSTTGTIDLHLQLSSPCIDPAGQTSTATVDIDGDVRPSGAGVDIGADEAPIPPEIDVQYNAATVASGGSLNGGTFNVAGQAFTFTIFNTGAGNLVLSGTPAVALILNSNLDATTVVQVPPALTTLPPTTGTTTFEMFIDPTNPGPWDLTVTIANNDPDESPYTFTIQGNAVPVNVPAQATAPAGSSFAGVVNGPFSQSADPAATLVAADIELTDQDTDNITVTSIVPPATALVGVTGPTAPAPGQPLTLSWTGAIDGSNAPGAYTWTITFEDAVNGTPVVIDVTINVNDVAPIHLPEVGITGTGSAGAPYLATYTVGLNGSVDVDLASVTDANTSQVLNISGTVDVSGLGGTGFQFSLSSGLLNMAPAGTLVAADSGTQVWQVTVTDGANPVMITVSITVNDAISFTSSTTLPAAHLNGNYPGSTITTTGGTGTVTMAVTSGALPANLTLSTAGVVSGTTTAAVGTYNFTVTATDSLGASTALAFSIDVIDPPAGLPVITTGATLPTGTLNVAYSVSLTVSGGTAPYTFSLAGGTLPPGLSLSATGVISGTPSVVGPSSFSVNVVDSSSRAISNSGAFTLQVIAPKEEDDNGSCTAESRGTGIALLVIAGAMAMAVRRRRMV